MIRILILLTTLTLSGTAFADVCARSPQVVKALQVATHKDCSQILDIDLEYVTRLNIENVTSIKGSDFDGVFNLTQLTISESLTSKPTLFYPDGIFSGLTRLSELTIAGAGNSTLPANPFRGLTNLRLLSILRFKLNGLAPDYFADQKQLQNLDLELDDLGAVTATTFAGLGSLKNLNLRFSTITDLPSRAFADSPQLEKIALSGPLTNIASDSLAGLTLLHDLQIEGLNTATLPIQWFKDLTSLTSLYIGNSKIDNPIDPAVFDSLTQLNSMWFQDMKVLPLNPDHFINHPLLKVLTVANTPVVGINNFMPLTELTELTLSGVGLASVNLDMFHGLTLLEHLDLSNNPIYDLQSRLFVGLPNIKSIELSKTKLTKIPDDLFAGCGQLEYVGFEDSNLSEISSAAFIGLPKLDMIYLLGLPNLPKNQIDQLTADLPKSVQIYSDK